MHPTNEHQNVHGTGRPLTTELLLSQKRRTRRSIRVADEGPPGEPGRDARIAENGLNSIWWKW